MSLFHAIYGKGGSSSGGIVTKLVKNVTVSNSDLNNVTINISSDVSNYKSITNDNIIIEFNDIASKAAAVAKLNHTYDANTGIITITSNSNDLPFASKSETTLELNVFLAGKIVIPPVRKTALTVNKSDKTTKDTTTTLAFVLNVGQLAILSAGSGDTDIALNFASGENGDTQGWTITNKKAILGSIRGAADKTSSDDNVSLGCLVVMPTEETGAVSISRSGGSTTWTGISYIILDINEV